MLKPANLSAGCGAADLAQGAWCPPQGAFRGDVQDLSTLLGALVRLSGQAVLSCSVMTCLLRDSVSLKM